MNHSRHRFVGQCAGLAGTAAVSAVTGRMPSEAAQAEPLRNWAGNYQYSTNRLTSATSVAQIREFVRAQAHFKMLGTRHCFNGIADSADHLLSLREMPAVVAAGYSVSLFTDWQKGWVNVARQFRNGFLTDNLYG